MRALPVPEPVLVAEESVSGSRGCQGNDTGRGQEMPGWTGRPVRGSRLSSLLPATGPWRKAFGVIRFVFQSGANSGWSVWLAPLDLLGFLQMVPAQSPT